MGWRDWVCGRVVGKAGFGGGGEGGVGLVVRVDSLRGEEGREVSVEGFALRGVLKGDLKGWERVWDAVSMRRRLEG